MLPKKHVDYFSLLIISEIGIFVFNLISPLLLGPLKKMKPIHSETVARAMIIIIQNDIQKTTFESNEIVETFKN